MAVHGIAAYREAIETALATARWAAARIDRTPHLELVREPDLSIVMFRRVGWDITDYREWSDRLLADGIGFVLPSTWDGETILRLAILNPATDEAMIDEILATLDD